MGKKTSKLTRSSDLKNSFLFLENVGKLCIVLAVCCTWTMVVGQFLDIRLCGVLAQSTKNISNLRHLHFPITFLVKELESFLKICYNNRQCKKIMLLECH